MKGNWQLITGEKDVIGFWFMDVRYSTILPLFYVYIPFSIASRINFWINIISTALVTSCCCRILCTVVSVYLATLILNMVQPDMIVCFMMATVLNALCSLLVLWNLKSGVLFTLTGTCLPERSS